MTAFPLSAQGPAVISGRVLRRGGLDTLPAPAARVVLHRLTQTTSGPLDSTYAGPAGRFQFRFSNDTGVVYLVSARWAGIEYFSEPVSGRGLNRPANLNLLVADTSSLVPISVSARFVIVGAPDASRHRTMVDLYVLHNNGERTRVGADSLTPTWRHVLPPGVTASTASTAGSEISPEAVRFVGDTVQVYAPLPPGDKQLLLQHTLPISLTSLKLPMGEGADTVQLVAEESGLVVRGLEPTTSQVLDGRPLARWMGGRGSNRAGSEVVVTFPVASRADRWLLPALAGGAALVLLAGAWLALRRPARPVSAPAPAPVDLLVDQIARLDAAHRDRALSESEQTAYVEQRTRLKQELIAALAARRGHL